MPTSPVLPRAHAMVLCDEIEPADEEEVFNLVGVRTRITADGFPYVHPRLCVYMQATGHQGVAHCRIAVSPAGRDEEVFSAPERPIDFGGPLQVVIVEWEIESCTFPDAGLYYVQAY